MVKGSKGKPCSVETKEKIRQASLGRTVSEETRNKLRIHNLGKHPSDETRMRMSQAQTPEHRQAARELRLGVRFSDVTKKRMSVAQTGRKQTAATKAKLSSARGGNKNPNYRGGLVVDALGYVAILSPEHPHSNVNGYVAEHRLVVESVLGRFLSQEEVVHHINGNPLDNSKDNLVLFANKGEHTRYHNLLRKRRVL